MSARASHPSPLYIHTFEGPNTMLTRRLFALAISILCGTGAAHAATKFTYFGELSHGDTPATGSYRFTITPYADAAGTRALAPALRTESVRVVDGKFRAPVSFDFEQPASRRIWLGVEAVAADGTVTAFDQKQAVQLPIPSDTASTQPRAPQGGTLIATASRFSVMWLDGAGAPHRAAIRDDGSIRDTDDPGLVVTIIGTGQFCIQATSVSEGVVGVAQWDGAEVPRTIDVTMGISNPCNAVPSAQFMVQTWTQ
jgi:hypothetical protein